MAPSIALPISPRDSETDLLNPSYNSTRRSRIGAGGSAFTRSRGAEMRDEVINNVEKVQRRAMAVYKKMTPLQRVLAGVALLILNVLIVLFLVFNERIFGILEPYAVKWKQTTGGWIILWGLTFLAAFPPMIGYSSCGTVAGFVYGVGEGWLIYATATVAGSYCSFIVSRTVLRKYVERMVANDKRFAALTLTLKEDGLKLLCMIRLCPLPYSLSNGAMSTFPTVKPQTYALATAIITPKLFIHVFIGSRLAAIAKGGEMTGSTKLLNWGSIIFFGVLGASVGWFIYRKTMQRARELEAEEQNRVQDTTRRTGGTPPEFMDDPEAQAAAETLAHDDDDVAYFDDVPSPQPYRDGGRDDDDDIFAKGDGDDIDGQGGTDKDSAKH